MIETRLLCDSFPRPRFSFHFPTFFSSMTFNTFTFDATLIESNAFPQNRVRDSVTYSDTHFTHFIINLTSENISNRFFKACYFFLGGEGK